MKYIKSSGDRQNFAGRLFLDNSFLLFSIISFFKRFFCLVFLILIFLSVSQAKNDIFLKYPKEIPKIDFKTQEFLKKLPSDSTFLFWVFFTDKKISTFSEYKEAIQKCFDSFTPKAIKRRKLRGKKEIFDLSDLPVSKDYIKKIKDVGVKIRTKSRWLNGVSIEVTKEKIDEISRFDFVRSIKKVVRYYKKLPEESKQKLFYKPEKGLFLLDYGQSYYQLAQIYVPELHQLGYSGKGVLICILDTGFRKDHPAFKKAFEEGRVLAEYDFINNDKETQNEPGDPEGQDSHGTCVWSALGGFVEDTLIGPAYGASFLLAKTEMVDQEIIIEEHNWVAGIEWAESEGADIVTSSLGYNEWYTYSDMDGNFAITTIAADIVVSKGVVVVNAAGNEGDKPWYYIIAPADGDSVIAVGAVDKNGNLASFSSRGPTSDGRIKPDVVARGVNTFCAFPGGGYGTTNGTSLSTPLVAGVCALLLDVDSTLTPIQIRKRLWETSSQAENPDNSIGYGIVNALKAAGFHYPPLRFEKIIAYPNPFDDSIYICVKAAQGDDVKISVFTLAGEVIRKNLLGTWLPPPNNFFKSGWNGTNQRGEEVANGVYLIYVNINGSSEIYKVAKIR